MKLCPKCKNRYTDDTLAFCLQDGAPLVDGSASGSEEPTVAFGEGDVVASTIENRKIAIDVSAEADERETQERIRPIHSVAEPVGRPGKLRTVLMTVAAMLFLFVIVGGVGVFYYLSGGRLNRGNAAFSESSANNGAVNGSQPGTPTASAVPTVSVSPEPGSTPQPSPTVDPDIAKRAVEDRLETWEQATERRDLDSLIGCYADPLDYYYSRRSTNRDFVRNNKSGAFEKYDRISITISKLNITAGGDGDSAVATFDKEWRFSGGDKTSTGKVRSQFSFERVEDAWLIIGEKDLKVYYTN